MGYLIVIILIVLWIVMRADTSDYLPVVIVENKKESHEYFDDAYFLDLTLKGTEHDGRVLLLQYGYFSKLPDIVAKYPHVITYIFDQKCPDSDQIVYVGCKPDGFRKIYDARIGKVVVSDTLPENNLEMSKAGLKWDEGKIFMLGMQDYPIPNHTIVASFTLEYADLADKIVNDIRPDSINLPTLDIETFPGDLYHRSETLYQLVSLNNTVKTDLVKTRNHIYKNTPPKSH